MNSCGTFFPAAVFFALFLSGITGGALTGDSRVMSIATIGGIVIAAIGSLFAFGLSRQTTITHLHYLLIPVPCLGIAVVTWFFLLAYIAV